jgi:hypothetical protein
MDGCDDASRIYYYFYEVFKCKGKGYLGLSFGVQKRVQFKKENKSTM